MSLVADVRDLAEKAVASAVGTPAEPRLRDVLARLDEPLRVAVAGKVKAGKSTLLNALVGEELAPTDAGECTRIVTWYRDGITYRVRAWPAEGPPVAVGFHRDRGALEIDLSGVPGGAVGRLEVEWPSARLREMTLIDTPGIDSVHDDVSQRTFDALAPGDDRPAEADAVLYLMRHMHGGDVRFLESFHDDELAHPSPVNAIGVLSRADEIGACRPDAMESAGRIAARYRAEPKLRRLCQTVIPVAGLLAQAGATLVEAEFRALGRLAELPADDRELLLLSVDRFVVDDPVLPVTAVEREDLVARFGLFGVRQAVTLIASGTTATSGGLSAALLELSGIGPLREVLISQFGERAAVLKARSALAVIESLIDPADDALASEVERITASAHELVEIRLLNQLRLGGLRLRPAETADLERLIGGGSPAARLGLSEEAGGSEVQAAALEALGRWQSRAESPMSNQAVKDAARAVVRTCEGLLALASTTERHRDG
jgi:hypothetical protein